MMSAADEAGCRGISRRPEPMAHGCAVARAHAPGGPLHCAVAKPPRCRGKLTAQEPLWLPHS